MLEPIFIISQVIRRCPFSKKMIKPKNMLCVFNKYQYNNFVFQIVELLLSRLPEDIIHIIIKLTNYIKLLNKTGLEKIVNWTPKNHIYLCSDTFVSRHNNLLLLDNSDSDSDI